MSLIAIAVFVGYGLNADVFLGAIRRNPIYFQIAGLGVLAGLCWWRMGRSRVETPSVLSHPLIRWTGLFLVLASCSLFVTTDTEYAMKGLLYAVSTAAIVTSAVAAILVFPPSNRWVAIAAVGVLFIGSASLFADPFLDIRGRLPNIVSTEYELSRSGGIFLQPNIAGIAIPFALSVILPRVRAGVGLACTAIGTAAVLLTFSRSGLLLMALLVALAFYRGFLPRAWGVVFLALTAYLFVMFDSKSFIQDAFNISQGSGMARLVRAQDFLGSDALRSDTRVDIVSAAWDEVLRSPLVGGGIGRSWYWAEVRNNGAGTHNMYLRFMLEFGLIGALVWPLFLYSVYAGRNRALDSVWSVGVVSLGAVAGVLSHNMTEQGVVLLPLIGSLLLPTRSPQARSANRARPMRPDYSDHLQPG